MAGDWIKAHRDMMQHAIWKDEWLVKLFLWCLFKAAFAQTKVAGTVVMRGQFITGRFAAARELGVHPSRFYRGINKLQTLGCISLKSNTDETTITVCKYETYQESKTQREQPSNTERTLREHQSNTEEEDLSSLSQEVEEGKDSPWTAIVAEIEPALLDWLAWWNRLHSENLVLAGVDPIKPNGGIVAGWKRFKRSAALRECLSNRAAVEVEIRRSKFVQSGSWFTLAKLFGGKNKDGEIVVERLLAGGYRDKAAGASRPGYDRADPNGNQALVLEMLSEIRDREGVVDGEIV